MVLESAKSQVDRICKDILNETLDPAKKKAEEIKAAANREAEAIIEKAQSSARDLIIKAENTIKEKESAYRASIDIATKNALESLRQRLLTQFFREDLRDQLNQSLNKGDVLARIIDAVVEGTRKDGIDADLKVYLSKFLSAEDVRKFLTSDVLAKLDGELLKNDQLADGIRIVFDKGSFALDFTSESLTRLVEKFAFDDLKDLLFNK